jgi:class 3 adenylate cyclase
VKEGVRATWVDLLRRLAPLLPADRFDRLRGFSSPAALSVEGKRDFADSLRRAIATLDSLHHTLTTFLPRCLLDMAPVPGQPHGVLLEGSFIFADVTGFTALTGELSRQGTAGLEEMNRVMRALFAALLEPLLASGGDLLIFAGDAVLACFPARPDGQDARWATRTALRLVEAIAPFASLQTPYGMFSLTMSVGVERGRAFAAVVGARQRMEFLVSGGPVQGAMQAEGLAAPGQVVAGAGVQAFLRPQEFALQGNVVTGLCGRELDDYEAVPPSRRRGRSAAVFSRQISDLLGHLDEALEQVETIVPFIPPDLFTQIARAEDIRQHPPVAVQFINVVGIEELALGSAGVEQATAVLQRYFVQAQEIVAEREGIVSQVDPYARGFTLLNPFGAPTHHEGVPRLGASAALELARALEWVNQEFALDPPLVQRTGMTYGRIFTGEIGYRHRREYVVAGPTVNLAARMMSKAEPGQIVLDQAAWEAVQEDFTAEPLPPIPFKGIPGPTPRFALQGLRKERRSQVADYPLVGRRRERVVLEGLLEEAASGRGGALAIVGEAGFGKNCLADTLSVQAQRRGMAVLTARCRSFSQAVPYRPWADLVGDWFGLDEEMPAEARHQRLRERLAEFDLLPSLPAFVDLLGLLPVHPPSRVGQPAARQGANLFAVLQQQAAREGVKGLDLARLVAARTGQTAPALAESAGSLWEALRERASIPNALHLLLECQALRQPALLVIEDLQWMDPDSRAVLESIAVAAQEWPFLLLVTARPGTPWEGDRLVLPPLSSADSLALAALALRATRLETDLADWLLARVQGNPLFVLSYCRALRDAGAVVVDAGSSTARWSGPPPALPPSLQELLLAQVERVGQETREALRRAAVIGVTFPVWLLAHLCRDVLSPNQLSGALEQAARHSLIAPPPFAQAHTFGSESLHDAIYGALAHATRRQWHEQAGDLLAQDEAARYGRLEQIAYHYGRGDNPHKAARFARLAGDKARARQAEEAALAFYAQALAVADGDEVAAEQQAARESIGDLHALRGEGQEARTAYRAALLGALPEDSRRLEAKLALLTPLTDEASPAMLDEVGQALPSSDPLKPWLRAAQVWLYAGHGERAAALALGRDLLRAAGDSVATVLREAVESLDGDKPLPPYTYLFAVYARSCLRLTSGGGS